MITSNVSKRYARAFFAVAGEENRYEKYYGELQLISSIIKEQRDLKEFLLNPVFEKSDKKIVIEKVSERLNLSITTANFLKLLVEKGRMGSVAEIEENYRKLMDEAMGIARAQVKTAFALTSELSDSLKRSLEALTGKKVELDAEEDRSLLGGIIVAMGDRVYDGSVKAQLNNMRKLLEEEM